MIDLLIRIGLIGCGEYCSKTHARFLSKRKEAQIVAISECVYSEELRKRQQQFGIPHAFSTYTEMLSSVDLDGVVISTPHAFHYTQAKRCLELGVDVLVDKPPACRAEEAQALVDIADSTGCHLVVASQRRYIPVFRHLRDTVLGGELGSLRFVEFHYSRSKHPEFATSWRSDPSLSGGGVLFDAGYHMLDSLLWITNSRAIRVRGSLDRRDAAVETSAAFALKLTGGVSANVCIHLEMQPHAVREEIGLFGSKETLLYQRLSLAGEDTSSRLVRVREGHRSGQLIPAANADQAPTRNFLGAILGQEPVESSGRDSIETVRTIEWIYRELGGMSQGMKGEVQK